MVLWMQVMFCMLAVALDDSSAAILPSCNKLNSAIIIIIIVVVVVVMVAVISTCDFLSFLLLFNSFCVLPVFMGRSSQQQGVKWIQVVQCFWSGRFLTFARSFCSFALIRPTADQLGQFGHDLFAGGALLLHCTS